MDTVQYQREGRVAYIGLNRPEKLNAINDSMRSDLSSALAEFAHDDAARVGVLYGEGRAFCVGMDLSPDARYVGRDPAGDRTRIQQIAETWLELWDCPKPLIAQVHGFCFAGGTQIPLCCDIVTVADDTILGWPKLPVGAGWISPMWSFFIGVQRAKLMSYRVGSTMTGSEAYHYGYATEAYGPEDLSERTYALATEIAKLPSDMLQIKKLANNRTLEGMGFRNAVLAGAEWDAIAHTTESVHASRDWIQQHGLRAAIAKFAKEGM